MRRNLLLKPNRRCRDPLSRLSYLSRPRLRSELDGNDLRRTPIEERKDFLATLLNRPQEGIAFNQHYLCDGAVLFKHACALGCEGVVSKRLGSPYRSGRVDDWLKVKNPAAPAVRREADEDWGGRRRGR